MKNLIKAKLKWRIKRNNYRWYYENWWTFLIKINEKKHTKNYDDKNYDSQNIVKIAPTWHPRKRTWREVLRAWLWINPKKKYGEEKRKERKLEVWLDPNDVNIYRLI